MHSQQQALQAMSAATDIRTCFASQGYMLCPILLGKVAEPSISKTKHMPLAMVVLNTKFFFFG